MRVLKLPCVTTESLFKNDAGAENGLEPAPIVRYMFFRISVMLLAPLMRPRGAGNRTGMQE
jgi:hypothetical protein